MKNPILPFLLVSLTSMVILLLGWDSGILHDNIIFVSNMGNDLYQEGILNWGSLKMEHDPGHPPFCATYLAAIWTWVGRSLQISHLALFPFIVVCQSFLWAIIGLFFSDRRVRALVFLILSVEPTYIASLTLIGPEVFLLSFVLSAIYFLLSEKRTWYVVSMALLGISSMRGMMLCAGLFLIDIFLHYKYIKDHISGTVIRYLLASIPGVSFVAWRLLCKGWITSNPVAFNASVWPEGGVDAFVANFIHNCIVIVRWYGDFGRIVPILFIIVLLFLHRDDLKDRTVRRLLSLIVIPVSVIAVTSLIIRNPMGHRYYTLSYLFIVLLALYLANEFCRRRWAIFGAIGAALVLGNMVIYPDKIAQGWDASLAHIHYWPVRRAAIDYINDAHIDTADISTYFGNYLTIDDTDLSGDMRQYGDASDSRYVMVSNVYNLPDEELQRLENEYHPLQRFSRCGVWIDILERRK